MDNSALQDQGTGEKQNKTRIIIVAGGVILVIVLFLLSIYFFSSKPPTKRSSIIVPTKITNSAQTIPLPPLDTVEITNGGFVPAKIIIKRGAAIRWINNSNTDEISVNSDNYPTNQLYPELNLGKVNKGQIMAHIFTTTGVYTYHNQFKPEQSGTVVVQ